MSHIFILFLDSCLMVEFLNQDGGLSSGIFEVWTAIFDQSAGNEAPFRFRNNFRPSSLCFFLVDLSIFDFAAKKKDTAVPSSKQAQSNADFDSKSSLEKMLDAHMSDMNTILNGKSW